MDPTRPSKLDSLSNFPNSPSTRSAFVSFINHLAYVYKQTDGQTYTGLPIKNVPNFAHFLRKETFIDTHTEIQVDISYFHQDTEQNIATCQMQKKTAKYLVNY